MPEGLEKNERNTSPEIDYIKKKFDKHLLNKIKYIKDWQEIPKVFRKVFGSGNSKSAFDKYSQMGEFFLIDMEGKRYLAHVNPTKLELVDDGDNFILPSKLERELKLSLFGLTLRDLLEIIKKRREDEENKKEKKIVRVTESQLVELLRKIIGER